MAEITIAQGAPDDVREIQRRREREDIEIRLALQSADRGTVWVARDDGDAIAIAIAHDGEDERYIGDLFVEPSYRGQGLATQLLQAAFLEAGDGARTMLVEPRDPAALALALHFGVPLRETILRVAGAIPREEELAKMAAGENRFEVAPIDPVSHRLGLSGLDRQTRGTSRAADHVGFARSADGHAFFLRGEFVGYAYVWPDGRIGPLACASQAYFVQIFAFALVALQRRFGASWCTALVPGSNLRIARAALRSGLRIHETFTIATDAFQYDLSTYVGYHALLF